VALCLQQHEVITSQMPSVKTKVLTGMDNVDRWTDQGIWDLVLKDIRVVVSTHAILADALGHGFVQMSRLALLVFDEGKRTFHMWFSYAINLSSSSSL
jgi:ERCC4-related helicase